ncbi:MAG: GTPase Era, partial [Ruminococcaceae bacterium]|nr:GTPase Era [Oscillospiraceae bacterium]
MKKSAFIAVVGRANVGKSSFVNRAVGEKVAIVSDKPQTTRTKIMGVLTRDDTQMVFIDTPGFHKPHNTLGENMIRAVGAGLSDVDAAVFMVEAVTRFKFDPENLPPAELKLMEEIKKRKIPAILAVNKIDLLENKADLLPIISAYSSIIDFETVVPFSAKSGDGVEILVDELMKFCKESVHYFDSETVTDQSDRTMIAEMIREKLLRTLDNEVPHGIAIDIEQFFERDNREGEPILNVSAVIYCERESHKGIIIGKNGSLLKKIGTLARKDIEEFYGIK